MDSFTLVIFGVTGNLSQIKLIPTLYDLVATNVIDVPFSVLGIGRKHMSRAEFESFVSHALHTPNHHHQHPIDQAVEANLLKLISYQTLDIENIQDYANLKITLSKLPGGANRMYYLATLPSLYRTLFTNLEKSGLNREDDGWVRVMIEKPIGLDLQSARNLNKILLKYYVEDQIYRLDHYLGKETLQNILAFRFGNGLFEPLMNSKYIDHIQVTELEDFGIGNRGGYYDSVGALRDVGQNHDMQMLVLATMDKPQDFSNAAITKERVKLLNSLSPEPDKVVFGQYEGYQNEPHVDPNSSTETYFALRTHIDNPRFKGVPIYMRSGKFLTSYTAEVVIVFKNTSDRLLTHLPGGNTPNALIYRIQPNEGIVVKMLTKVPGHTLKLQESYMQYCYKLAPGELPDAYEKLILDALRGDQTFFNDAPEVEAQWRFTDNLMDVKPNLPVHLYPKGSTGPSAADKLIEEDGRSWIEPSALFCNF